MSEEIPPFSFTSILRRCSYKARYCATDDMSVIVRCFAFAAFLNLTACAVFPQPAPPAPPPTPAPLAPKFDPAPTSTPAPAASTMPDPAPQATQHSSSVPVPQTGTTTAPAPSIDVWERIRRGFAMPELDTQTAINSTRWYAAQPDYIGRMSSRAVPYLFHIVEEIEKRGMPTELALLPFVESAMQPEAVSHAKAVGLWQFIPSTGKLYALEQNAWRDQRRDVVESTRAALDYLQKLHDDFGDWHLALAAYNCGEGCVGRAVARNRAQRKPTGYSQLRLPRETLGYVPKLQAIKNIVRDPQRYGLALPAIENKPYFVALTKARDIDVTTAARLAEMHVDEFRALNPAFTRPVIVGATQPSILLPADRERTFLANLAAWESTGQPLASWTTYTLTGNETMAQVAARVGVPEGALREANHIPPRYRVATGSTILIPRDESMYDDIAPAHINASFAYVPERANLKRITYRVRRGDTLAGVARRWNVSQQDIVAWNRLHSRSLFAGQRLNLTVSSLPARAKTRTAKNGTRVSVATSAAATSGAAVRTQTR